MLPAHLVLVLLLVLVSAVAGSALTFTLGAKEASCFCLHNEAAHDDLLLLCGAELAAFDVDYTIKNPRQGRSLSARMKQRQGEFCVYRRHHRGIRVLLRQRHADC